MRTLVTAKQTLFFSQNGYIELGGLPIAPPMLLQEAREVVEKRQKKNPAHSPYLLGRDLWRDSTLLQNLLVKQLKSTLFSLHPHPLRLALDQWFPQGTPFKEVASFPKLFSLQGFVLGVFLADKVPSSPIQTALGLSPFPKEEEDLLFVKPKLLIDWPALSHCTATDLYFCAYTSETALYIYNPNDPLTYGLKELGYQFGDKLENHSHPLLFPTG